MDGAGVRTQYRRITPPLCRAALATPQFTRMYNDFLWALVFISDGDKPPATSALNNPRGRFFTDRNLPAAGSVLVALPTGVHGAAAAVRRPTDPGGRQGLTAVFPGSEATGMRRWPGLCVCRRR